MFGNKEEIINMIKVGNWVKAATFADQVTGRAVLNNEDWWWNDLDKACDNPQFDVWNSTSYGNTAFGVVYGAKFPERHETIRKVKDLVKMTLN